MIKKSSKDFVTICIYALMILISFVILIIYRQIQFLFYLLIFVILIYLKIRQYKKNIENEQKLEEVMEKLKEDKDKDIFYNSKKNKKEQKDSYNKFVNSIEDELGEFDVDEYLEDDNE